MHFTPPIFRQILQWILVVAMVAVFGVSQDTVSTSDRVNHIYEVNSRQARSSSTALSEHG